MSSEIEHPSTIDDSAQTVRCVYTSSSINRHAHCSHIVLVDSGTQLLAFGSDNIICLARLVEIHTVAPCFRILHTLIGHTSRVNCVRWISFHQHSSVPHGTLFLASADSAGMIKIWKCTTLNYHSGSAWLQMFNLSTPGIPNDLDGYLVNHSSGMYLSLSVAADKSIRIWHLIIEDESNIENKSTDPSEIIEYGTPMCLCLRLFHWQFHTSQFIFFCIVGLDDGNAEVWCQSIDYHSSPHRYSKLAKAATITGHTDWVVDVDVCKELGSQTLSVLVATGGQDHYVRLWRISEPYSSQQIYDQTRLSAKICDLDLSSLSIDHKLVVTSESVLAGHANCVTGVSWAPQLTADQPFPPNLLTSSFDESLIIWSPPKAPSNSDGLWIEHARLGNVSGNSLGFLDCMWSSSINPGVCGHTFQGSLSIWFYSEADDFWSPGLPLCGHVGPVKDLTWAVRTHTDGTNFLLSCGTDQTVRAHVSLTQPVADVNTHVDGKRDVVWQELARPQVHGYDMNSICALSACNYVSAGDEKVSRIFTPTRSFMDSFEHFAGADLVSLYKGSLPLAEGAVQPTLGLTNQVISSSETPNNGYRDEGKSKKCHVLPTEDHLRQSTLWPEVKKLYGHPYEVYSLASHPFLPLIASACVSSKTQHASIIVWDGNRDWAIHQHLTHHMLTVTQMRWNSDGMHLLAVSRDRTWSVWTESSIVGSNSERPPTYALNAYPTKGRGHSRIVWTGAWDPASQFFCTGSRDRSLLIWPAPSNMVTPKPNALVPLSEPKIFSEGVTSLDLLALLTPASYLVAVGLESGKLYLLRLTMSECTVTKTCTFSLLNELQIPLFWSHVPNKQVRRVLFKPTIIKRDTNIHLATAADDGLVRIFELSVHNFK